jgi:hypothetical protein
MALEELVRKDSVRTTRRTVVSTGVKLAYATPSVAASMKLGTNMGMAASPGANECQKDAACAGATVCNDGPCACFFTAAGNTRCFAGEFSCDHATCTTDGDCAAGEACSNTCCGLQCAPLCSEANAGFIPGVGSSR